MGEKLYRVAKKGGTTMGSSPSARRSVTLWREVLGKTTRRPWPSARCTQPRIPLGARREFARSLPQGSVRFERRGSRLALFGRFGDALRSLYTSTPNPRGGGKKCKAARGLPRCGRDRGAMKKWEVRERRGPSLQGILRVHRRVLRAVDERVVGFVPGEGP